MPRRRATLLIFQNHRMEQQFRCHLTLEIWRCHLTRLIPHIRHHLSPPLTSVTICHWWQLLSPSGHSRIRCQVASSSHIRPPQSCQCRRGAGDDEWRHLLGAQGQLIAGDVLFQCWEIIEASLRPLSIGDRRCFWRVRFLVLFSGSMLS